MHVTSFGTETRAYFPVSLQPVFVGDEGSQASDFHAVVREDTGAVLGIHRGGYKLVPNRAIFEPFEEAIGQSGIALDGIVVEEGIAYSGRTVVREYAFPAVTLEPRVGDVVEFKMKVVNSYDATNAFRALMGGRRRLCINGMVGQEQQALVYARHTNGFSSQRAVEGILKAMERYLALDSEWKRWARRAITAEAAAPVFEAMPGSNPRRLEVLRKAWEAEIAAAGPTVWALYNTLTRNADSLIMPHASLALRSSLVKEMISFGIKLRPGLLVHVRGAAELGGEPGRDRAPSGGAGAPDSRDSRVPAACRLKFPSTPWGRPVLQGRMPPPF